MFLRSSQFDRKYRLIFTSSMSQQPKKELYSIIQNLKYLVEQYKAGEECKYNPETYSPRIKSKTNKSQNGNSLIKTPQSKFTQQMNSPMSPRELDLSFSAFIDEKKKIQTIETHKLLHYLNVWRTRLFHNLVSQKYSKNTKNKLSGKRNNKNILPEDQESYPELGLSLSSSGDTKDEASLNDSELKFNEEEINSLNLNEEQGKTFINKEKYRNKNKKEHNLSKSLEKENYIISSEIEEEEIPQKSSENVNLMFLDHSFEEEDPDTTSKIENSIYNILNNDLNLSDDYDGDFDPSVDLNSEEEEASLFDQSSH